MDKPFVSFLEYKNPGVKVQRIDADISETLQEKDGDASEAKKQAAEFETNQMQDLFREVLGLKVEMETLKTDRVSAMILLSEESRRMMEMMEAYAKNEELKAMFAGAKPDETLVLNRGSRLVTSLVAMAGQEERGREPALPPALRPCDDEPPPADL